MDPITAISLASSLITFVDFASKVVGGTYEVYHSTTGAIVQHTHIDTVIRDLQESTAGLEVDISGSTKHDKALKALASNCKKTSDDLLQLLTKLKVDGKHSTWKSLKTAINGMRKEKEIAGLEKQLNDYRSQILLRITLMLQDQNSSTKLQLDRLENATLNLSSESALRAKQLREDIVRDIDDLLKPKEVTLNAPEDTKDPMLELEVLLNNLSCMVTTVPKENEILKSLFFENLDLRERTIITAEDGTFEWLFEEEEDKLENERGATGEGEPEALDSEGFDPQDLDSEEFDSDDFVSPHPTPRKSLSINGDDDPKIAEDIDRSQSSSPRPAGSTSVKELSEPPLHTEDKFLRVKELKIRAQTRRKFLSWLDSNNGVFHISGKAGSGKSTLMKFICNHKRTVVGLENWAGEKKLVFAQFYFWKSKDEMQTSLEGLYRSILFTTLKQCPELIPSVFPRQWDRLQNQQGYIVGNLISYLDLVHAFETLTVGGTFPKHRFCYFVDGLDEYQGHSLDHVKLAKCLQRWANGTDVKICASSRPYVEYERLASSLNQKICLHELTRQDIYLFSRQMIEKDDNFGQVKDSYLDLVAKIVDRSEGVFLWARLVVNSLLVGMLRHDHVKTLEKKLEAIPGDMNQLYHQLLNSLDEHDRERAIEMLLLTAHVSARETLNSVVYWWLDHLDDLATIPKCNGMKPRWCPSVEEMNDDVQLRVKGLTKGLLETTTWTSKYFKGESQSVQFFHRTVRDFVTERLEPVLESGRYDRILNPETHHLLRLAEFTVCDVAYRRFVWNHGHVGGPNNYLFHIKLSADVLDGFRSVLDDGDTSIPVDPAGYRIFRGAMKVRDGMTWIHRFSFVHMAAYCGQYEYILRELKTDPTLLDGTKDLSILASAIAGGHKELVETLLERGSSPSQLITCWDEDMLPNKDHVPMWLLVFHHDVSDYLAYPGIIRFDLWELLLGDHRVNASNCFFLLCHIEEKDKDFWKPRMDLTPTHFVTLKQVVEHLKPSNMEKLLTLIDCDKNNSYLSRAGEFISRFIPRILELELMLETQTAGYIQFDFKNGQYMRVTQTVCDDIRVENCAFRVY